MSRTKKKIREFHEGKAPVQTQSVIVAPPARVGAPLKFNQQLFDDICYYIASGMSLRRICAEIKGMPTAETVRVWLRDDRELSAQYARAREEQADFYADRLIEIADSTPADRDAVEKAKLQSDNIKWVASKLKPKKYGDKLDLTSDGEQLPVPITALQVNMPGEARQLPAQENKQV